MTIKYEPVFGPQELFDDVPEYIEFIRFNDYSREYLWGDQNVINHLTFKDLKAIPIIAMRRIIKTPIWTWEDKKAGRLPEVGCVVMAIGVNEVARIAAINNDSVCSVCVVFEDGDFITLNFSGIAPIETPEEKAQREEDEFVTSLCKELDGTSLQHDSIYERGVRAAYRKLKTPTND